MLAEPPVTIVDRVVDKKEHVLLSEEYLKFLYTPEGQRLQQNTIIGYK
jgi:sulfate transport system substrate-binding protein